MNKTLTINLANINFYIDEDAFIRLDRYLKSVSASLDPESKEETMKDIEARIAELFLERIKQKNEVVDNDLVEKIILTMGKPEDYTSDFDSDSASAEQPAAPKSAKKLYRDIENRVVGGVCSGLGHYFGIDRVWLRVIFLLLFLPVFTSKILLPSSSTVFLIYVILWIVVPAARTTSEKLEMQGDKIDIGNIERKVKEEYRNIKNKINKKEGFEIRSFTQKLGDILLVLLKVVSIIIGVLIILIAGISLIALLISFLSLGAISISGLDPWTQIDVFLPDFPNWITYILLVILCGVPLLLLLFAGLKIINPRSKPITLTGILIILGIWILSFLPFIAYFLTAFTPNWNTESPGSVHSVHENLEISDTLVVKINKEEHLNSNQSTNRTNSVSLKLKPSSTSNSLTVVKEIYGSSYTNLEAKELEYHFESRNDTLFLSDYASLQLNQKSIPSQKVKNTLYLKEGIPFTIDAELAGLVKDFPKNYFNRILQFEDRQLTCLNCSVKNETQDSSTPKPDKDSTRAPRKVSGIKIPIKINF